LNVENERERLNELELKVKSNADLSDATRQGLLDHLLEEERQINFASGQGDQAQVETLTAVEDELDGIESALSGAPEAEKISAKIDKLVEQVDSADFPEDQADQKDEWLKDLGTMKSALELEPSDENQKAAKDLLKEIEDGMKPIQAKIAEQAKVPQDLMDKLKNLSATDGALDETYILNRLQEVYGSRFDYDGDGSVSMDDFSKAVDQGDFPPVQPDKYLLEFIYKIDPLLQDRFNEWSKAKGNPSLGDARDCLVLALQALYPDAGVGAVADTDEKIYFGSQKVDLFDVDGSRHHDSDSGVTYKTTRGEDLLTWKV